MASFGNPKHKKKTLECAWQPFGTQSSFWIKVKFDSIVRWKGLDKYQCAYNIQHTFSFKIK
jgi:hypothetical protein